MKKMTSKIDDSTDRVFRKLFLILEIFVVVVQCSSTPIKLNFRGTRTRTEPREEFDLDKNEVKSKMLLIS